MKFTPGKINLYLLFKLPSAFLTGVRTKFISDKKSIIVVKHRWINQNPFKSMFWAVQGMAAEFSTGVLMVKSIRDSGERISMLVTNMDATFTKKARGRITFTCDQGDLIQEKIKEAIATKEGQTVVLTSEGVNEEGISVSKFNFEWSIKVKS